MFEFIKIYLVPIGIPVLGFIGGIIMAAVYFMNWFNRAVDKKINDKIKEVTNEFTQQHENIVDTFDARTKAIEQDIIEVKQYMHDDQKYKIDLSKTLGKIENHMAESK